MRRTLILTALGATTLSIGLGVGATLANPAQRGPTAAMMGDGNDQMHRGIGMMQMMHSAGRHSGMDAEDMNGMHAAMHAAMSDDLSAAELAACDSAHAAMTDGPAPVTPGSSADHAAHHPGARP